MNSLLLCLFIGAAIGVVLSLPVTRPKLESLLPTVRGLGATKFVEYVHETGLTVNFTKKAGNFTLFVPTNKAFKDLPHKIARNKTALKELLLFHSLNGTYFRKDLKNGTSIKSLLGRNLTFNVTKEKVVLVNGVNITKFNVNASNGVIFLVDKIILNGSGLVTKSKTPVQTREAFDVEDDPELGIASKFLQESLVPSSEELERLKSSTNVAVANVMQIRNGYMYVMKSFFQSKPII